MMTALLNRSRKTLAALIITLCANDEFILSHIRIKRVILRTEKRISELPIFFFFAFQIVLYLLEYSIPPLAWKILPFSRLSAEKQLAYLEGWESSRFAIKRNLFRLVKAVCICQIMSERKLLIALGYGEALEDRLGRRPSLVISK